MKRNLILFFASIFAFAFSSNAALAQISNATLTNRVIFNFDAGDIIETENSYQNYNPDSVLRIVYTHDSIISKTFLMSNSTVQYVRFHKLVTTYSANTLGYHTTFQSIIDTITYNNLDSTPTMVFPVGIICNQYLNTDTIVPDNLLCNATYWNRYYGHPFICGQTYVCYSQILYYTGLGGPYYNAASASTQTEGHKYIVYFKKSNVGCGARINFAKFATGINEVDAENKAIQLFPNPSDGSFTIHQIGNDLLQFNLYNLIGEKVFATKLQQTNTSISNLNLLQGAYLFNVSAANGQVLQNGKMIVE